METRTFTLSPLRRPAGRVAVHLGERGDAGTSDAVWKDRAAWLLEALGARWTRRTGYHLAPSKAEAFAVLYPAGWHGRVPFSPFEKFKPTFSRDDGPELTLAQALAASKEAAQ